jgi:hypothetical protein
MEIGENKMKPKDKFLIIEPFEDRSKTISVLGSK